jgi:hypothetical protein
MCPALNVRTKIPANHSPTTGVASACRDFSMGVTLAGRLALGAGAKAPRT